ncbi:MAG: hypothetical protein ABIJ91_01680 [Candidatus Kuenenbacteria bacterium]
MMKKSIIGFIAFTMVLTMAAGVFTSSARAASDGDLIKMDGYPAVYYLNGGKRYVFPNAKTYNTWYSDFSGVVTISQSEMETYPLGGNVTYRPGTRLVKIQTVPTVYSVEPNGALRSILSEANAIALYGSVWNTIIDDVPDAFFVNYTVGDDLVEGKYPTGTITKEEGAATTYYIDGDDKRPIATGDAFDANNLNWSYLVTASDLSGYSDGTSISGAETGLTTVAGSGGGAVVDGSVTVALASDTAPAGNTYMESQARASFLTVNVTNGSSADVTIDSVTIERGGYALNADFASVALFEDSVTGSQVGLNKTFNSDNRATVGDDVVVKAGTTKKLIVAGNMAADPTLTASTPKLGIYAMVLKAGATLNGTLPIWGNIMTLNTSVVIASATVDAGGSNPTADNTPKVGDLNEELTQIKITNGSASEVIQVEKFIYKQAGTVADSDILSYSLYDSDDGTKLASAPQVDKYIEFDLKSSPVIIGKSKNKEFMVKADEINGGSSRTIQLDIYRNTDVVVKGNTYNAYVIPTFPATSQPYFNHTIDQTIGNGSLKVEPDATFVAQNIAGGKSDTQLGQWLFTIKGEGVDITNIEALLTVSGTGNMDNITSAVFYNVETGAGLTGAVAATGGTGQTGGVTSTDTISLPVGIHKIGIKATLNSDFANNTTIIASIDPDTGLTTTGVVTGNGITETPASYQNSATLTVKAASMQVSASTNPAPATIIRGTNELEVANIQLDASASGDELTITQLKTVIHPIGMNAAELSNLKLWDGTAEVTLSNDPDPTLTTAGTAAPVGEVTTTWSLSPALKIAKGTVKVLKITANIASTPSADETFAFGFQSGCTATTKDSEGVSVTPTYAYSDGQTMTVQTAGSLTLTRSDELENGFLAGSTNGLTLGKFKAKALYEDAKLEKVYVDFATASITNAGGTDEITALYLYDGATQVASATITSSNARTLLFNMDAVPYTVPVNTEKELTLKADTGAVDKSGGATNASPLEGFTPTILSASMTVKGASGNAVTPTSATLTFPSYVLVKSKPTVTIASTGDSVTANSNYDLIDVTVAADSKGPVGIYKMTFRVATTTVTVDSFEMYEGTTLVSTESSTAATGVLQTLFDANGYDLLEVYFNSGGTLGGRMREVAAGSSKTYTLKGTVTGYTSNVSNSVSTSMTGDDALAATTYTLNAVAVDATDDDDFIWSDLSYGNTSTTATTTAEWMNGYLVDGLLTTTSSAKSI